MLSDEDARAALTAALVEIERFVSHGGWDQPARLFALVETDQLIEAEPALAGELGLQGSAHGGRPGALTSIEQEDFTHGSDLGETLAQIAWPLTVHGCALTLERAFQPAGAEQPLPADADAAARSVLADPRHDELRLVCGATRTADGQLTHGIARIRSNGELLSAPDLIPGLGEALADTLAAGEQL